MLSMQSRRQTSQFSFFFALSSRFALRVLQSQPIKSLIWIVSRFFPRSWMFSAFSTVVFRHQVQSFLSVLILLFWPLCMPAILFVLHLINYCLRSVLLVMFPASPRYPFDLWLSNDYILPCATVTRSSPRKRESRIASIIHGIFSNHPQRIPNSTSLCQGITFNTITIRITLRSQVASNTLSFALIWLSGPFDQLQRPFDVARLRLVGGWSMIPGNSHIRILRR
jgi:hypothetical protein